MSNAVANSLMANVLQGGVVKRRKRATKKGGVAILPLLGMLASHVGLPLLKEYGPEIIKKIRSKLGVGAKKRVKRAAGTRRKTMTATRAAGTRKRRAKRAAGYKISGEGKKKNLRKKNLKPLTPF